MTYESQALAAGSLLDIRVGEAAFACRSLASPWQQRVDAGHYAVLYAVSTGRAVLSLEAQDPLALETGAVVSLVGGQPHRVADSVATLRRADAPVVDLFARVPHAGPANGRCRIFAARVPLTANPLPTVLPELIHVRAADRPTAPRLHRVLELAVAMDEAPASAREPLLRRVAEMLAIELTEFALARSDGQWRSGLTDARIQRAVGLMRVNPGRPWTLPMLAAEARMSRSAFAARFRTTVGTPPMDYLRRCRVEAAAKLLAETDQPLYAIANRVGYRSDSAFSRAFELVTGEAPGRYRRRRQADG